jgi:multicomponent Na+:H+ antiporter subunit D
MLLVLPVLLPIVGGIFVLRQTNEQRRSRMVLWLTGLTTALAVLLCLLPEQSVELLTIQGALRLSLQNDGLAKFFMALVSLIWVPVAVFSFPYLKHAGGERQFLSIYTMTQGILMGLALSRNFITMYMFFEMMSMVTMPLVLHNGTPAARRAGFQYLGYSVFGAGMALAGFFFLAYYEALPDFTAGGALDPSLTSGHQQLLVTAWLVMIVGFGAKAGMMPMQAWLPAAHPVAPAPASAVLSGVITKGGVLAIIRVTYYMFGPAFLAGSQAQELLLLLALATVFVGSMLALREQQFKKRLAYSTVSQVSYVLFGLLLLTPEGVRGALLQMVFHALAKDTLFLAAGAIILSTNFSRVDQLRGIGRRMPVTTLCFALASMSLIGIPPMAGFISKWYLAAAALENPIPWVGTAGVAALILSALLTAGYLLPIVADGFFPGEDFIAEVKEVGRGMTGPMVLFAVLAIALGIFPGLLLGPVDALCAILF